jgi:hypothetical protein
MLLIENIFLQGTNESIGNYSDDKQQEYMFKEFDHAAKIENK